MAKVVLKLENVILLYNTPLLKFLTNEICDILSYKFGDSLCSNGCGYHVSNEIVSNVHKDENVCFWSQNVDDCWMNLYQHG